MVMKKLSEWDQSIENADEFIQPHLYLKETIIKIDKTGNVNIMVDGVAVGMMKSMSIVAEAGNHPGNVISFKAVQMSIEDNGDGDKTIVDTEYTDLGTFLESLPIDIEEDGGR